MLDVTFTDLGNNKRVSPIFMTFGQFMDHDFAYVIHGPQACALKRRYFLFGVIFHPNKIHKSFPPGQRT